MRALFKAYMHLEKAMVALDGEHSIFAEQLRDVMDPIWRALTDHERHLLDCWPIISETTERQPEIVHYCPVCWRKLSNADVRAQSRRQRRWQHDLDCDDAARRR